MNRIGIDYEFVPPTSVSFVVATVYHHLLTQLAYFPATNGFGITRATSNTTHLISFDKISHNIWCILTLIVHTLATVIHEIYPAVREKLNTRHNFHEPWAS